MVDIHGVIGWLRQLMQDANASARLGRGAEYSQTEVLFAHYLRAGEGEQDSSGLDLLEGDCVELAVALQGVAQHVFVLGECGRIENDQVLVASHALQILEGVLGIRLMAGVVGEVERHVLVGQGDGLG